jgi:hypothetical protein
VFYFPKTKENAENLFKNWKCPHCREIDPIIKGGTVAHEIVEIKNSEDKKSQFSIGMSHPEHRVCMIENFAFQKKCSSCRVQIDPLDVMTRTERAAITLIELSNYLDKTSKDFKIMNSAGSLLFGIGIIGKFPLAMTIGSFFMVRALTILADRQDERTAYFWLLNAAKKCAQISAVAFAWYRA